MTDLTDEAVKALLPKAEAVGDHYVADFCRAILDARAALATQEAGNG